MQATSFSFYRVLVSTCFASKYHETLLYLFIYLTTTNVLDFFMYLSAWKRNILGFLRCKQRNTASYREAYAVPNLLILGNERSVWNKREKWVCFRTLRMHLGQNIELPDRIFCFAKNLWLFFWVSHVFVKHTYISIRYEKTTRLTKIVYT